jgi:diguanylate cyclase (GGDEF)-like protein
MILLQGYEIGETLYQSGKTAVFRATRLADRANVVCKVLRLEYPTARDLASFRREHEIGARFSGKSTVKILGLERAGNSLAIIMEDFGGIALDRDASLRGAGIGTKLAIAVCVADALSRLHRGNVIHRDINPSNVIRNPTTCEVKIVDFGIAAELRRESANIAGAGSLEGTLPYLSPEQTGRMNRPVDHRTDLYAFGAMLFELFTGRVPFTEIEDLALIHAHLAKTPPIPRDLNPEIPETVSAIILKLLAKMPEDRYQSAEGLLADLERCRESMIQRGSVDAFPIGQSDGLAEFATPSRLYGREAEIRVLREACAKAVAGAPGLVLVSGGVGVGKTSVVREILASVPGGRVGLVTGKYSQAERNIPYSGLFSAFQELLDQILCTPAELLDARRRTIQEALGDNAGVLVELVPKLQLLLGPQGESVPLDPVAAQHRLQNTVRSFLEAVVSEGQSLVVFLDDLQWCDSATIDLIRQLLGARGIPRLLVVGAYRDGEVTDAHPLAVLLKSLGEDDGVCLALRPLTEAVVNQFVADTLRCPAEECRELSAMVFRKTEGNPFFTHQLLLSLHAKGAFLYQAAENRWSVDLQRAATAEPDDNIADFLSRRLQSLPEDAKAILKAASCIGHTFDLRTLTAALGADAPALLTGLWEAMAKELVVPLDREYRLLGAGYGERLEIDASFKFQHDRLLQAAHSLVAEGEEAKIRHRIGREMLAEYRETGSPLALFALVGHLNAARTRLASREERLELVRLNILAAGQAMAGAAFRAAVDHYDAAESLLVDGDWAHLPERRFDVLLGHAEARFLAGEPAAALRDVDKLHALAGSTLERAAIHRLKSRIVEASGDLAGAIAAIRSGLQVLGLVLPESKEDIERRVGMGLGQMQQGFALVPIDKLPALPRMEDREKIMAMRLLAQAVPAAIQFHYPLYLVVTMMMLDLTLQHGLTPESCKCVADCGIIYTSVLGDYETGYRLGKAAFALIDRLSAEWQKPPVCFSFTYVSHMRKHFSEGLDHYEMSYRSGLKVGDIQHANYARAHKVFLMTWVGANLQECRREAEGTIAFLKESQGMVQMMLAQLVLHAIRKLEATPEPQAAADMARIDGETLASIEQFRNMVLLVRFAQYEAFLQFLLGETAAAERWNKTAESVIFASGTDFPLGDHYLVRSLLFVDKLKAAAENDREPLWAQLTAAHAKLKKYADNCPENFAHKHLLVSAEIAVLRGESLETVGELYRRATSSIGGEDFPQMLALINERQAAFWVARGDHTIAKAYLREARFHYARWGAFRKVDEMEARYRDYLSFQEEGDRPRPRRHKTRRSTDGISNAALDIDSIIKATQAISGEIRTGSLLRTLLSTIIENAGAQNGCFLLAGGTSPGGLHVAALKDAGGDAIEIVSPSPSLHADKYCREIVDYVERSRESVVLDDATKGRFAGNAYISSRQVKSLLCMPIVRQNALKGVVYLENNLTDHAFTVERLSILSILASQASISIENAQLYEDMESKVRDRTKRLHEANEKLRQLTLVDPLTHLNNRRYYHDYIATTADGYLRRLNRTMAGTEQRKLPDDDAVMGIFLVDIDNFKQVNDTWGHAAGDTVLVAITKLLKSIVRPDDFTVRWGGEEFLLILKNTSPEYLDRFAQKVLNAVRQDTIAVSDSKTITRTCSIGYAQLPFNRAMPEFLTLEQTIKLADHALYAAKQHGRNRAVRISMKEGLPADERARDCLMSLSQNSPDQVDCVELTHVGEEE